MKNILPFTIFFALLNNANSQIPDWAWAKRAGGTNYDGTRSVAIDASGNSVVVGWFTSSTIIFGSDTLTNSNSGSNTSDMFLAKYDGSGNILWAKKAGGTNWDDAISITIDANGNIYLAGGFYSPSIIFGNDTLMNTSSGTYDMFIVKYDASGNVLFAKSAGGVNEDIAHSVSTDSNGNILVAGSFASSIITLGSVTLANRGSSYWDYNIFLVKYDATGSTLWARGASGTGWDMANSVTSDTSGNIYVTGYFRGPTITFDSTTLTNSDSTGNFGTWNMFLAKYDLNGNILWANSPEGMGNDEGSSVATDANENVYVAGYFGSNTLAFGSITLLNGDSVGSTNDMFLAKYDSIGNILWAKSAGGTYYDGASSLTIDTNGNIFVAGSFASPTITFDSNTLTNTDSTSNFYDIFLAQYDTSGNVLWAKSTGGSTNDGASSVTSVNDNIILAGNFESPSITFGSTTLTNAVNTGYKTDMFIAKLDGATRINEFYVSDYEFQIYPNPASGSVTIKAKGGDEIIITDIAGRKIKTIKDFQNSVNFSTNEIENGIYFLALYSNNRVVSIRKLIVAK